MKATIKKLVKAIESKLSSNAYSNEMGLLMSGGENFGQCTEPNFTQIVKSFNLTREILSDYINQAKIWADKFNNSFPKEKIKYYPWGCSNKEEKNYWQNAMESLHCIFMTGIL